MPPQRREGQELTEAVERLRAGGIVFLSPTQTPAKPRDKNNGSGPTQKPPTSEKNMANETTTTTTNGKHHSRDEQGNPGPALEQLAGVLLGKLEKGEALGKVSVEGSRVTTVRSLGEKAVDGGIMAGAVFVGVSAGIAFGKYVLGIGKTPKGTPVPTA
jgi:hypothetical protein